MNPEISLRPWVESDAEALFALAGDPVIGLSAGFPPHRDVEDSRRVIREILSAPCVYAVVAADDDAVVGCVSALPCRSDDADDGLREIGYWIGRRHWNRGFATAAVSALRARCLDKAEFSCRRLVGRVREENAASRRVLEKCGFRLVGTTEGFVLYES